MWAASPWDEGRYEDGEGGGVAWKDYGHADAGRRISLKRTVMHHPLPFPKRRTGDHSNCWSSVWREEPVWGASWSERAPAARRVDSSVSAHKADIKQWQECTPLGKNVPGTPIVPCKTPFDSPLAERAFEHGLIGENDWFGKAELLRLGVEQGTPIGLVVDMVNTSKYYGGFDDESVEYQKVQIPGRQVPDRNVMEEIFDLIDDFVARRPGEYVAVHCTHGINRTGFLVAAYLMTRAHLPQHKRAIAAFEKARGMNMDKQYLVDALKQLEEGTY